MGKQTGINVAMIGVAIEQIMFVSKDVAEALGYVKAVTP